MRAIAPSISDALVTALMPLKNYHPAFLEAALHSLFQQTDARWRLCVVVEADALDHFKQQLAETLLDSRVQLVVNQGSCYAAAFNTGMRAAQTPFTAILFGDDLWTTDAVATLNEYI